MIHSIRWAAAVVCGFAAGVAQAQQAPVEKPGGHIDLPSSKQIGGVVPGLPQQLSSTPVAMAVSPDGRYVVTVNGGYGSYESSYDQSLAVLDTRTGKVQDFPDARTSGRSGQVLFSGLAFSGMERSCMGASCRPPTRRARRTTTRGRGFRCMGLQMERSRERRSLRFRCRSWWRGRRRSWWAGWMAGWVCLIHRGLRS